MNINVEELLKSMLGAAQGVLKKKWPDAKDFAEQEFRKLLEEAKHIAQLKDAGKVNEQEATLLMNLQRNAARAVLLTIEGLGILAVENAINAALAVVKDVVNKAAGGWMIL